MIFWGSQSGTAEGFAARLARELHQRFRLDSIAADLSDFDPDTISLIPQTKIAIFILSTYGEGDPSDNANTFWDYLTKPKDRAAPKFPSLRYAAFGLGNSQYRHYNRVVDVVDNALQKAGAERLLAVGRADDGKGMTEEDFFAWKDQLFTYLVNGMGLEQQEIKYEAQFTVVDDTSLDLSDLHAGEPVHDHLGNRNNSDIRPLKIRESHELFNDKSRNCLHMDLDLTEYPHITYKTGDHLAVWAINPEEDVERLLRVLGMSGTNSPRRNTPLLISALDPAAVKVRIPSPTTAETMFRYYLEICGPVSRDTVRGLAEFAPGEASKSFLLNISKDRETFSDFTAITHVNITRLLDMAALKDGSDIVWSSLPLSYLIEAIPRMQPRYYSISSSSVITPRTASITALVSSKALLSPSSPETSQPATTTHPAAAVPGLASNYLLGLSHSLTADKPPHPAGLTYNLSGPDQGLAGGKLFAHIRRSKFKLPALASCPLILVAAGTGIAPFRAFLMERARLRAMGREVGEVMLFFGCRRPEEDYIYREELEQLENEGLKGKLRVITAFSRTGDKTYVQDKIVEYREDVTRLLRDDQDGIASLYICGRASMAREVGGRISELMRRDNGWSESEASEWSESMKRQRKWQEDVWG